ncbi:nitronate monooxygenase family protein [Sphingomonas sp. NFR15]|uniref:NAD(P)H-dependent flavin oxidoreductase n=1 Tax=Sphingomonas sp. NFR15 TaxID=1566282 RepID=UPI00088B8ABA|nr:nitronate monooxygenase [Sphingomonas sp. NFR15]SDA36702.1 nitronate monooxygenase [Sphingomonas sp. NFR15]
MTGVRAFLDLSGAHFPLLQAPMAGFAGAELAIAAIGAGAVGSLACATLSPDDVIGTVARIRAAVRGPLNLNVFCHRLGPVPDTAAWETQLAPCYVAENLSRPTAAPPLRRPFDAAMADAIDAVRPEIVSFHFGLPEPVLLERVRATGARLIGNATTVAEARFLASRGCDAIIAQGFEAGGHAGHFLNEHRPVGLIALVPAIVDAVTVPVIAAGGIADERGVRAAIALGAAAVQVGTAFLRTPEARPSAPHRAALGAASADDSVFTNLFSGGLARGLRNRLIEAIGPVSAAAPPFPYASAAVAPLRAHAESEGRGDYSPLWAGQGVALAHAEPAAALTRRLGLAALAMEDFA